MNKYKKIFKEVYSDLGKFSLPYTVDIKRFCYSLKLLDCNGLIEGKCILDLGSGVGIMAIAFSRLGARVTGIDKFIFPSVGENPYRVSDFKKLEQIWQDSGVQIIEGDIIDKPLPFADQSFDVVNFDATIEHLVESPKQLFGEVHRVLKPGGIFLVTTPNLANLLRRIRFVFGLTPYWDIKDYFESYPHFTGHRREFTVYELRSMLEWSSFKVTEVKTANIFFEVKRFVVPRKFIGQLCNTLSLPFPDMREMIYMLAKKT
ncbi:MAG: hypothetical protein A2747_00855 [Candidatus Yonathbacteria bacterium RIFCSPHIGHO2_01_FULL_44_41]|uniref:Methyltransferase type 11 domain-containing protein n=1 Tax=Candidatus Yonathbacteria bacterium RIFCSPHIGHO2_02_FULL_44_14 TaxID=1802724 RepID=A0A1G2S6L7_9BACT|nr:MAG: hypothetical protein A2747_00855 [Candidatus Yonathbacteria bacterium RIFCSPHIGHO2_01_FULL_44_41]OHA80368.1 MAG: hypothetical protein A3D51_03570 [Candidatus Yonathbacteria bacterium RIFCSPHIGHO2_02_FULL_44_14]OHA80676.1 MAG: hypothetical protein A3B06_03795 [Candidatus Yonathbacteria bacterium RIFCSPLOWO2_01_FULL_43_20]